MEHEPSVGQQVKVKTATGDTRTARVAQLGVGVIYVTSEEEYNRARTAGELPTPFLGFPTEDVYEI